jgi:hypothetical protein
VEGSAVTRQRIVAAAGWRKSAAPVLSLSKWAPRPLQALRPNPVAPSTTLAFVQARDLMRRCCRRAHNGIISTPSAFLRDPGHVAAGAEGCITLHEGNAKGREPGSRNKLTEDFLATLYTDWQKNGAAAIVAMREADPAAYVKVVASLVPREASLDVNVTPTRPRPLAEMTDADWEIALGIRVTKRSE